MGFFRFFKSNKDDQSAKVAKDRLQVLIAHERTDRSGPDYLPMLRQDILDVIKKYVAVGDDALSVQIETQDDCDVLELNITLPEDSANTRTPSAEARRRALERRQAVTGKVSETG
jgi:cell division topological specificity factor